MKLPSKGWTKDAVEAELRVRRAKDIDWRSGRTFGYVFDAGREAEAVGKAACAAFLCENALDPTSFPSLLGLENEIVQMVKAQLGGDADAVGSFTSGGTESILLAVKTARDRFRETRPDLARPQVLLPVTAHAAFHKAAKYFDLEVVAVPVDDGFRADPDAMREAAGDRTILMVGSAPSYAHGVIDPIEPLAAIALEKGIWFHVDACVGGMALPFLKKLGEPIPAFDLSVPGVTSLSVDLHKYGFTPKGASVLLWKSRDLRRHQFYACARWTGYSVINQTIQGTRSGGPLAGAWATLHFLGESGYLEIAKRLRDTTRALREGIEAISDLRILGDPDLCLLAFTADGVSVFHIADEMNLRGWYVQAQLGFGGSPPNIHLTVGPTNDAHVGDFLVDLRASVEAARALPPSPIAAMAKGAFAQTRPEDVTPELLGQMLQMAGVSGTGLPERRADINEVLDALPPALTERLLIEFMGSLFSEPAQHQEPVAAA